MLIHRIAAQVATSAEYRNVERLLGLGDDATLAIGQSARPLVMASVFARNPRPTLVVVAGEDAADRMGVALSAYLGRDVVERYPDRPDLPWSEKPADGAIIGARCRALSRLAAGEPCVVVSSARALLRCVPPAGKPARDEEAPQAGFFEPAEFEVGQEIPFDSVASRLLFLGYESVEGVDAPGTFHVHGDTVDIFPSQAKTAVRLEFFGDEIDGIRRLVVSTGQTIGGVDHVTVYPCRELALTPAAVARCQRKLYKAAQEDPEIARHMELLGAGVAFPGVDRYLPHLYPAPGVPLDHVSRDTLVVVTEPRSLFDDCAHAYDDLTPLARAAKVDLTGLYLPPAKLDFGDRQRMTYVSLLRAGAGAAQEMRSQPPDVAGGARLVRRLASFAHAGMACVFAVPDGEARRSIALSLTDEHLPIVESLGSAPENRPPVTPEWSAWARGAIAPGSSTAGQGSLAPLRGGIITLTDVPIPAGIILPDSRLAVVSAADMVSRMAKHARRKTVDVTDITFPFKPGDYVVHATHGIALFKEITRREVGGRERDYFLLEYAAGDKLYVPFEQVDRLTRYVGPDGDSPRLTRLNTADWSRATTKARKAAKQLAFDLVDLYTRRSAAVGYAFGPDTPWQREMEESFPYELTADQAGAIVDIKADMESSRPMDRLLCGDVGFGKT